MFRGARSFDTASVLWRLIDAGAHACLGMTEEQYRRLWPEHITQPGWCVGTYDTLVLVDRALAHPRGNTFMKKCQIDLIAYWRKRRVKTPALPVRSALFVQLDPHESLRHVRHRRTRQEGPDGVEGWFLGIEQRDKLEHMSFAVFEEEPSRAQTMLLVTQEQNRNVMRRVSAFKTFPNMTCPKVGVRIPLEKETP